MSVYHAGERYSNVSVSCWRDRVMLVYYVGEGVMSVYHIGERDSNVSVSCWR